ncbi:hypothetical protein N7478_008093 [Penicillium angulare]|uniref:uncharacterized protein n=1 Tax=Penicillium angulare TaxID=116970 RepID=UPI00254169B8|nr:uncharacterized protein N7478_008093 [Penicillium angulare]KAJ5272968.1 hypothetical protein N7478_008093 [Penicillium angulare]
MNSLSPGHPLFNPRRVPPALKPIEETEGHYWSMRELTLFEREIKRQTDIRITEHTPAELNKMRRCKYCGGKSLVCSIRDHYFPYLQFFIAAGGSHHKKTGPPKKKLRMDLGCFWPDKMNKIFCHEVARVDLGKREYVKKAAIPNDFNRVLKAYFENAQLGRSKVVLCDQVKLMEMVVDMENQLDNTHFLIDPKNHHLWVEVTGSSRSGYVMFEIYQVSEEKWKDSFSNACAPICAWHFGAFDGNVSEFPVPRLLYSY